ncbi:hypothetical protein OIDMADRAFT_139064, partial [Oidiodendron maius Zn]
QMKCKIDEGPSCRRCARAGVECIFKPRANAAGLRDSASPIAYRLHPDESIVQPNYSSDSIEAVLKRLDAIETFIGLDSELTPATDKDADWQWNGSDDPLMSGIGASLAQLRKTSRQNLQPKIWSHEVIKKLWLGFHKNMPGLHFLPTKQTFSAPNPLLLASMLYVSSLRHSEAEMAELSSEYFMVMCEAIAQLTLPQPDEATAKIPASAQEENAFQDVLGIILAGLTCEASAKSTGIWISIGYRLVLESCPREADVRSREWQRLFSGLQIIDLEHASLHMSCPIIPLHPPLPRLHISPDDDINSLSQMMHMGLTHFTGRGIPSIWSWFTTASEKSTLTSPFTPVDAAVIRDWATQLDRWLSRFTSASSAGKSEHDRKLIFRQYILHRLLVLSIYHPARGFNLFSTSTTAGEQKELLVSARAALKMQVDDKSVWANWDFVMITWAALLVLQGIEGGVGEENDLPMIQDLLNTLRMTKEPATGFRQKLADKLETNFQSIHTPPALTSEDLATNLPDHLSRAIFDEMSLQFPYEAQWSMPDQFQ